MRKLFAVAIVAAASLWEPSAQAACYPSCAVYCPTASGQCGCPKWTDRPCRLVSCSSWNSVGGCWYE